MKKVIAFVGSARKRLTHYAVCRLLDNLHSLGEIETAIIALSGHRLGTCRGCKVCFEKGEEFCPLKDDRDVLIEKMMAADGVIIATPNYSFQVSAFTKIFLDRLGFVFHRPCFFGKTFTSIVAQGIYGGGKVVKYLDFVGNFLGFNTVKGSCVTALEPMTEMEKQKIDKTLEEQSKRFYERLLKPAFPAPTLLKLWGFRMGRTSVSLMLDSSNRDYSYYQEKGWFQSDYFYPTHLSALKKAAGSFLDSMARRQATNRKNQRAVSLECASVQRTA
jgi:multimeric flavodoxin WrbA